MTDGTNATADLTGTFSAGQAVTIVVTIERSTAGAVVLPEVKYYVDAITEWSLAIDSYVRPAGPPISSSGIYIANDLLPAPPARRPPPGELAGSPIDHFELQLPSPGSPVVGTAVPTYLHLLPGR